MPKVVHDNVLGPIELPDAVVRIVDCAAFQRLRRLDQLGLASLVFPSARHTRFSHSLGSFEIMGRVLRQLGIDDKPEAKVLRAGALLHDLGHYPLSHVLEFPATVIHQYEQSDSDVEPKGGQTPIYLDPLSADDWLQFTAYAFAQKVGDSEAGHEALTSQVIESDSELQAKIDAYVDSPYSYKDVVDVIAKRSKELFWRQLVSSALDVDRLDYLVRDSFNTGTRFGAIELDHLIRRLVLAEHTAIGKDIVCVDIRGKAHLEHYMLARHFMYSQVIYHRVTTGFSVLAGAMWLHLRRAGNGRCGSLSKLRDAVSDGSFARFDDHWYWVNVANQTERKLPRLVPRIARALLHRRPPLTVWEHKARRGNLKPLLPQFIRHRADLARQSGIPVSDIFMTEQSVYLAEKLSGVEVAKYRPAVAQSAIPRSPWIRGDDGTVEPITGDQESIVYELANEEVIVRLYLLPSGDASCDKKRRCRLRQAFLAHMKAAGLLPPN